LDEDEFDDFDLDHWRQYFPDLVGSWTKMNSTTSTSTIRIHDDYDDEDCLFDFQELCRFLAESSQKGDCGPSQCQHHPKTTPIFVEHMNNAMATQLGNALIMSVNNNRRCSSVGGGGAQYMDLMISDLTATTGNYQPCVAKARPCARSNCRAPCLVV
jgi:hypothetical protein